MAKILKIKAKGYTRFTTYNELRGITGSRSLFWTAIAVLQASSIRLRGYTFFFLRQAIMQICETEAQPSAFAGNIRCAISPASPFAIHALQ
jgi:predicted metal-dependent hydrolase